MAEEKSTTKPNLWDACLLQLENMTQIYAEERHLGGLGFKTCSMWRENYPVNITGSCPQSYL